MAKEKYYEMHLIECFFNAWSKIYILKKLSLITLIVKKHLDRNKKRINIFKIEQLEKEISKMTKEGNLPKMPTISKVNE